MLPSNEITAIIEHNKRRAPRKKKCGATVQIQTLIADRKRSSWLLLWSSLVVIFDIIIIRIFDDSSVCSLFFSWFKFRYVWVWESRLTNICVNRFLSVITFLMGLSTEVSSSLGFNWVWLSGFKWVRFGTIADLAYYLHQSSCFGLKYGLVELAVELSLVFL